MAAYFAAFDFGSFKMTGLGSVAAYRVTQRLQEIGIRMALGSSPGQVQRKILKETVSLVSLRLLIGVILALALTRVAASLLYQIEPTDPLTLGVTTLTLFLAAAAAGFIPAFRASRVDPMSVLRSN